MSLPWLSSGTSRGKNPVVVPWRSARVKPSRKRGSRPAWGMNWVPASGVTMPEGLQFLFYFAFATIGSLIALRRIETPLRRLIAGPGKPGRAP